MQLQPEVLSLRLPVRHLDPKHFQTSSSHRDRRVLIDHADIRIDLLDVFQKHHFQIFLFIIDMGEIDLQFFQLIFIRLPVHFKLPEQIPRAVCLGEQAVESLFKVIIRIRFSGRDHADQLRHVTPAPVQCLGTLRDLPADLLLVSFYDIHFLIPHIRDPLLNGQKNFILSGFRMRVSPTLWNQTI